MKNPTALTDHAWLASSHAWNISTFQNRCMHAIQLSVIADHHEAVPARVCAGNGAAVHAGCDNYLVGPAPLPPRQNSCRLYKNKNQGGDNYSDAGGPVSHRRRLTPSVRTERLVEVLDFVGNALRQAQRERDFAEVPQATMDSRPFLSIN